ncbi:hypothetical protein TUM4249_04030 [Shewanella sp. KT0246]|nr:hypothetical protein TUM4249_04030 [Shewanella sp. KT0246]
MTKITSVDVNGITHYSLKVILSNKAYKAFLLCNITLRKKYYFTVNKDEGDELNSRTKIN